MRIEAGGTVYFTFFLLPFLLMGGLYGYLLSMIAFAISFGCALVFETSKAYIMSVYLVATLCFSLFSQYHFFKTRIKTLIAAAATLFMTSIIEMCCFMLVIKNDYRIAVIANIGVYMVREVILIFGTAFLLYLYFQKTPDRFKVVFPLGIAYTKAFLDDSDIQKQIRKTRISVKITIMIISLEVILGIAVSVFIIALFPDIKHMMMMRFDTVGIENAANPEGPGMIAKPVEEEATESSGDTKQQEFVKQFEKMEYRMDAYALSFDIKMMLLLLCVGVPLAAFTNFNTKVFIGGPLGVMADFMNEYANADDESKLEVGRKVDSIVVNTRDEIAIVSEAMKATVHAVEDYIGRINEKQEMEKELEVAKRSSEAKSSFLSNMSHEIRTPINAVLGMNEMILRESTDPQILEYAANVKSAGNSLLGIVNDILDFSKIEAGKMDILPVQYHLGSTINDLINLVAAKAADKGLELETNIDETIPVQLIGDEVRIKQCVTNILTNAVKYTEKGTVTLNVTYRRADDDHIMLGFRVVDTGIGIKEEDLEKLFSPFERIEEIRNRTIEGTGLGMSIVKKLLALMDTKLVVKSVYGEGSDFSFEVKQQVVSWEEIGNFKERYKEFLQTAEKYHETFRAPEAEILVVDDTVMNLTVIKGLLKTTKIKVDTAESGKETLEKVTKKRYDAIFIDHRMPEMDGIETLEAMKTLEGNLCKGVPTIALTANAVSGAREIYMEAGFDDYLSKPVNGLLLEDMLRKYLPEEKVQVVEESEAGAESAENSSDDPAAGIPEDSYLRNIEGVDFREALKNCGSIEVLENVVKEYLTTIDSKADAIEKYAADKDFRNFTVFVHALKSSSRLIGAMELSKMAGHLEDCGNAEDEAEIKEKTPELLSLFRSYKEKLAAADQGPSEEELPEIPADQLLSAFRDMKELLDAYDFDTADGIMEMLSRYRIPAEYKEKYLKVKELISAVDRDGLLEIL
ncbi:ATP-binding protein [Butyrivibrio sp. MC2021]|uniref:ATP-binding protein n=1 Tax=Butyrivibrio sp. MC2021 TaxID=1408306 RepID=UPI000A75DFD3|nr:ATP-binding protein [Butyrivibrio sp. MC2021]